MRTSLILQLGYEMVYQWIADKVVGFLVDRRRLRVTVHRAVLTAAGQPAYFVNITNLSRNREVEITHVYFDLDPQVHANQPSRPLPKRLKPDEVWETWVVEECLPTTLGGRLFQLARVRLSTGRVAGSKENKGVPDRGTIPGGP
jgi:hypothetical protein